MNGRVNLHCNCVAVFVGYRFVDFKQSSVALPDRIFSQPLDCVRKIEIDAASAWTNAAAFVANFLRRTRRNITRRKIAVARIFSLEIIIAICFGDFAWRLLSILFAFRNPDAPIIPERLRHERQLGLMLAANRNTSGMDLCERRVREKRASFIGAIGGRDVAPASVGREIEHVSIAPGREHHSIRRQSLYFSGAEIAGKDSLGMSFDDHQVEHFSLRKHLHCARCDLTAKRLIATKEQLLTGLSTCIKGPRYLCAAKRAVGEQPAIFAGERNALRNTLVDDVIADLSEAIHVRFTGTKIPSLYRVVKQSVNAVPVVLVVFSRIYSTLGCDRMRATRRILKAKAFHPITQFPQRRGRRPAGQAASDDDDLELSPVVRAN